MSDKIPPRPWTTQWAYNLTEVEVRDANKRLVARLGRWGEAALIARLVNAEAQVVEALAEARKDADQLECVCYEDFTCRGCRLLDYIDAALALLRLGDP